jgi:hypothetical protein
MNSSTWPKTDVRWYLGVPCQKCKVPILFAVDRSDGTGDSQNKSGGKLVLTCPREGCRHQANYTAAVISRYQKQDADLDPKPSKGKQ